MGVGRMLGSNSRIVAPGVLPESNSAIIVGVKRRAPAVAGMFYPADPGELRDQLAGYLDAARAEIKGAPVPKAMIAPHAGTIYSGPIAASAYARLESARSRIRRVVLLGPSHRVALRGIGAPSHDAFVTPLGDIALDRKSIDALLALPQVAIDDEAHRREHSLEVHLPFLQLVLDRFELVPLVVGVASADDVARVLDACWGGDETLIVVSSDLSHYHDYSTAKALDRETSDFIEQLEYERLTDDRACGVFPVRGLLRVARLRGMKARTVDLRNSGDTAGPRREVVGYGSYLVD
jgi:MEMO1 family protein